LQLAGQTASRGPYGKPKSAHPKGQAAGGASIDAFAHAMEQRLRANRQLQAVRAEQAPGSWPWRCLG
jgi:hypothetical protein